VSSDLLGLSTEELCLLAQAEGVPRYRGKQIAAWVYGRGAHTIEAMDNLPRELRARLAGKYQVGRSRVAAVRNSADGTVKLLLEMPDGATVETVGLPYPDRYSCCVSTQVGCAMGCLFCATGTGCTRNLTAGEIVDQVLTVREAAQPLPPAPADTPLRIDHVTFMGMGEPLLNYEATLKALGLLNVELGIGARNLTVSTAGIVPGIIRLAAEKLQVTLAVSLHAPDDRLRNRLMPGLTQWTIAEVLNACRTYLVQTGRRITFEYCLLDRENDGQAEALQLVKILRGLNCHVNLIPFNNVAGLSHRPSLPDRVRIFRETLARGGIQVTQRVQRGAEIDAACGQLRRREGAAIDKGSPRTYP
jgi:23S rRNA (adenine2503-C2)-methyltransferase